MYAERGRDGRDGGHQRACIGTPLQRHVDGHGFSGSKSVHLAFGFAVAFCIHLAVEFAESVIVAVAVCITLAFRELVAFGFFECIAVAFGLTLALRELVAVRERESELVGGCSSFV